MHLRVGGLGLSHQRDAEVADLHLLILGEEDVSGLDVSMDDPFAMRVVERTRALEDDPDRVLERQETIRPTVVVQGVAARHVLHDDVADVFLDPRVVNRDDVGVAKHPRDLRFIEEQLAVARAAVLVLERFRERHLDRDVAAGERIVPEVHDAHAAAPDFLDDVVLA